MSDAPIDEIREVSWQIGMLLKEHRVLDDVAVTALCMTMKEIATYGWGLDAAAANAKLSQCIAALFKQQHTAN